MELDDLKQVWNQTANKQTNKQDMMELIRQKSKGPIASLKTAFRRQMAAVTAMMAIIIATQAKNVDSVSSNILFWTYIVFCLGLLTAFYFNYQLTRKMETKEETVKENLERHVNMLERHLKWQNHGARMVLLFFILLLEIIPLFEKVRMLDTWHALSPVIRFSTYVAYVVLQYFLSRAVTRKKFGKHLDHLKSLLQEVK